MIPPHFSLGRVVVTPGALNALQEAGTDGLEYLARHVRGDWGDLDDTDKRENDLNVRAGLRILSAYHLSTGVKIWIITEADRSTTTILLSEEY